MANERGASFRGLLKGVGDAGKDRVLWALGGGEGDTETVEAVDKAEGDGDGGAF